MMRAASTCGHSSQPGDYRSPAALRAARPALHAARAEVGYSFGEVLTLTPSQNHRARRVLRAVTAALLLFASAAAAVAPLGAMTAGDARTQSFKLQSDGMRAYNEGKYKEANALQQQVTH